MAFGIWAANESNCCKEFHGLIAVCVSPWGRLRPIIRQARPGSFAYAPSIACTEYRASACAMRFQCDRKSGRELGSKSMKQIHSRPHRTKRIHRPQAARRQQTARRRHCSAPRKVADDGGHAVDEPGKSLHAAPHGTAPPGSGYRCLAPGRSSTPHRRRRRPALRCSWRAARAGKDRIDERPGIAHHQMALTVNSRTVVR